MPETQPQFSVEKGFLLPDEKRRGIARSFAIPATYDEASDYQDSAVQTLLLSGRTPTESLIEGG